MAQPAGRGVRSLLFKSGSGIEGWGSLSAPKEGC